MIAQATVAADAVSKLISALLFKRKYYNENGLTKHKINQDAVEVIKKFYGVDMNADNQIVVISKAIMAIIHL